MTPHILGRTILVGGAPFTVVGVLRPDFLLNREIMPTVGGIAKMDIFTRLPLGSTANQYGDENYNLMARLKLGVTPERAQADIDVIARRIRESQTSRPHLYH